MIGVRKWRGSLVFLLTSLIALSTVGTSLSTCVAADLSHGPDPLLAGEGAVEVGADLYGASRSPAGGEGQATPAMHRYLTVDEVEVMKDELLILRGNNNWDLTVDGHATGLALPTDDVLERSVGRLKVLDSFASPRIGLPSSFDISSEPYFPRVGDQGSQGSCAAWAMAYYAYGYLEARDQGWTLASAGDVSQRISPAWTYNKINGGSDSGSWMWENGFVITDWGAATLSTMPYVASDDLSWGNGPAWREAPLHRAQSVVIVPSDGSALSSVKVLLSARTLVTFAFDAGEFAGCLFDNYIMSSLEYDSPDLNHAQTIVGFDDAIGEDGEIGAFKVVNSWGTYEDPYTDDGYYWLTYDAFEEIRMVLGSWMSLTYIEDIEDYEPTMLSVWHFNAAPSRDAGLTVGIGTYGSGIGSKSPHFTSDSANPFPVFMCLDITEFNSDYENGTEEFYLSTGSSARSGTLSSFRVERYEGGYSPGFPTQASGQSPDAPTTTPGHVSVNFHYYYPMSAGTAIEAPGLSFVSGDVSGWVGVSHHFAVDGDSLQSGDVWNGAYTYVSAEIVGPAVVSFHWKVSSQSDGDFLRFYVDSVLADSISGEIDWQEVSVDVTEGVHSLMWRYSKDSSLSLGEDCGWIDGLDVSSPDDQYEENDLVDAAAVVGPGSFEGLVCKDDDWFGTYLYQEDDLEARIEFDGDDADLQLYLFGPDGSTVLDSSETTGDVESVSVLDVDSYGYYYLLVRLNGSGSGTYTLTLDVAKGAGDPGSVGAVSIVSGTGSFSPLSSSEKKITAYQGSSIAGSLVLSATSVWDPGEPVQLIGTPTWGDPASSFWTVNSSLSLGTSVQTVEGVDLVAPLSVGTYHLIFAFRSEVFPWSVASGTSSEVGGPVWGDGNDLATSSLSMISEAQTYGRMNVDWLFLSGTKSVFVPCDAVSVDVIGDSAAPTTSAQLSGVIGLNGWYRSSVTVTLASSDDFGSGVEATYYSIDGGGWSLYTSPFLMAGEGEHALQYYSVDSAGNFENVTTEIVRVDASAPVSEAALAGAIGASGWYTSGVTISLGSSDLTSGVFMTRYRLDDGSWRTYVFPFTVSVDGEHVLQYYSVDIAGNTERQALIRFSVDTTPPETNLSLEGSEGLAGWYVSEVVADLMSSDAASGVQTVYVRVDGGSWRSHVAPILMDSTGVHLLEFYAIDIAGNAEEVESTIVSVDTIAPETLCNLSGAATPSGWFASEVEVELSSLDFGSGVERAYYRINDGNWLDYRSAILIVDDGTHTFSYYSTDVAGNLGEIIEVIVCIDTSPPQSEIDLVGIEGDGGWYVGPVIVALTASDGLGSGVETIFFSTDGGQYAEYSGPFQMEVEGIREIVFFSVDVCGRSEKPLCVPLNIDMTPPSLLFSDLDSTFVVTSREATVSWTAYDSLSSISRFEVEVDGALRAILSANSRSYGIADLAEGAHQVLVRAFDGAGNSAESVMTIEVHAGLLDPEGPAGPWAIFALVAVVAASAIAIAYVAVCRCRVR